MSHYFLGISVSVFSFEQEQQFFHEIKQMLDQQTFERLILSQYKGELTQLEKLLSVLWSYMEKTTFRAISSYHPRCD